MLWLGTQPILFNLTLLTVKSCWYLWQSLRTYLSVRLPIKIVKVRFEDTTGIIRDRKSKDRQCNGQKKKDKGTNNDLHNTTKKTKEIKWKAKKKYHIVVFYWNTYYCLSKKTVIKWKAKKYGTVPKSIKKSQKKEEKLIILKHKYTTVHFPVLVQARL